jgi:hypothetical protein
LARHYQRHPSVARAGQFASLAVDLLIQPLFQIGDHQVAINHHTVLVE